MLRIIWNNIARKRVDYIVYILFALMVIALFSTGYQKGKHDTLKAHLHDLQRINDNIHATFDIEEAGSFKEEIPLYLQPKVGYHWFKTTKRKTKK